MASADDPAIVLEQFTNDASNLAPEITHLMEEIEAKDKIVRECESFIKQRDQILQKQIKSHGPVSAHPKEDLYVKAVLTNYERAIAIQDEKLVLAEKASTLLARHTKRLDQLIRELAGNGGIELDDALAGLLNGTATSRGVSIAASGGSGPGHVNSVAAAGTAPPSSTLANSNLARLVTQNLGGPVGGRSGSPSNTPTSATPRGTRESSTDAKQRRRLNLPTQSSNLRQSSNGPGTPKAGTPQPSGRAGSVPRGINKKDNKASTNKHLAPPKGGQVNPDSKVAKARKRKGATTSSRKKGGVSDADDSAMSAAGDESGSEKLSNAGGDVGRGKDGTTDERDVEMGGVDDDEEGGDTNLYCTCRSVSYGNMVACDSDDCPYEWFHWNCVGLTKEPPGKWYCEECKERLGMK